MKNKTVRLFILLLSSFVFQISWAQPSGYTPKGYQLFTQVKVDFRHGVFTPYSIPFDVPFVVYGVAPGEIINAQLIISEKLHLENSMNNCCGQQMDTTNYKYKLCWIANIFNSINLSDSSYFYFIVPPLDVNKSYNFYFTFSRKPSPKDIKTFSNELSKALRAEVDTLYNQYSNLSMDDFWEKIYNADYISFYNTILNYNSSLNVYTPSTVIDTLRNNFRYLIYQSGFYELLSNLKTSSDDFHISVTQEYSSSNTLEGNSALSKFIANYNKLIPSGKKYKYVCWLKDSLSSIISGNNPDSDKLNPKPSKNLTNILYPKNTQYFISNFLNYIKNYDTISQMLNNILKDSIKKKIWQTLGIGTQATDSLIETFADFNNLLKYNVYKNANKYVLNLNAFQTIVGTKKFDTLFFIQFVEADVPISLNLPGITSAEFYTRGTWSITPDLGILSAKFNSDVHWGWNKNYIVSPYFGVNFSFYPVNKQKKYSFFSGWQEDGVLKHLGQNLSAVVGATVYPATGNNPLTTYPHTPLFGNEDLLTGLGLRVSDAFRVSCGLIWCQNTNNNPLITTPSSTLANYPFVSISFDNDLQNLLKGFVGIFGISPNNTTN